MNFLSRVLFVVVLLAPAVASAQATRTWISGVGDDANPCSRTAPCKTFAGAISKTATGGEIDVLDPGGFGGVTITKSITLDGGGFIAGILVSGSNGININAAGAHVVLRNLDINGIGAGLTGVNYTNAASVTIERTNIYGFGRSAVAVAVGNAGALYIKDSHFHHNGIDTTDDYASVDAQGSGLVTIARLYSANTPLGVQAALSKVSIFESTFFGHNLAALKASGTASINMDQGMIASGGTGVSQAGSSVVRLSDVMLSHNNVAFEGNVTSFGNNAVNAGNTSNGTSPNAIPLQ